MPINSTYKTQVLLPRKRRAYQELFVALLFMILAISSLPYTESYDRQTFLYNDFIESRGCVLFDDCPEYINKRVLGETGGLYPPQYYARDSKDYWRSFCTYAPALCK